MLDEISAKLRGATVKEIVRPICCFRACKRGAEFLVALRFADQKTDLYGLCKEHKTRVQEQHPATLAVTKDQGVFFFA